MVSAGRRRRSTRSSVTTFLSTRTIHGRSSDGSDRRSDATVSSTCLCQTPGITVSGVRSFSEEPLATNQLVNADNAEPGSREHGDSVTNREEPDMGDIAKTNPPCHGAADGGGRVPHLLRAASSVVRASRVSGDRTADRPRHSWRGPSGGVNHSRSWGMPRPRRLESPGVTGPMSFANPS
jgi:hypothetical protein